VNVNVSDISVDLERVISENNLNVQVPVAAVVQVPVGIAANVCNVSAAVLARQAADGRAMRPTKRPRTRRSPPSLALCSVSSGNRFVGFKGRIAAEESPPAFQRTQAALSCDHISGREI
jgi:hypothetical protein